MRVRVALTIVAALALVAAGCQRADSGPATAPAAIEARAVQPEVRATEETIAITGSLLATVQAEVKTEIPGRLLTPLPREGEWVRQGQVLARLDDSNYRLAVQQAEAAVAVAAAALERAHIAVGHASRELERARSVQASGGITMKDFQAAEWAERDARAQEQLARAQLQQARESLAAAGKRLRDCTILAPISGEVQAHLRNAGEYLDLKEPLVRLVDNSKLELSATVPTGALAQLRPRSAVHFWVDSYAGETFTGTLLKTAPAVNERSRSLLLRIAVENSARKLKSGMFVRGELVTGAKREALLLPLSAVVRSAGDPSRGYAVLIDAGAARRRDVDLGAEQDGRIEVTRGLDRSAAVLAEAQLAPAEGTRVKVR